MFRLAASFRILPVYALLYAVAGCCPGLSKQELDYGGQSRIYHVHEPDNLPQTGASVVVVLHGAYNTGCDVAEMSRMNAMSDEKGFLVVYPDGAGGLFNQTWNATLCCDPARQSGVDDAGFIDAIIDDLGVNLNHDINPKRIYVAGFSNGGMMAHAVACRLSHRVAAVGIVAGTGVLDPAACGPAHPVSVIAIHGDQDPRVQYNGGTFPSRAGGQAYPGIREVVAFWRDHNQAGTTVPVQPVDTVAEVERYTGGIDGTEVVLYTVQGGNHSWPGGRRVFLFGQNPTPDFSATTALWEFFDQHPKP
jgi:polyhydroxybutyrate depolymerase